MAKSIVFLSGSLREGSFNTRLARIAARSLPEGYDAVFFDLKGIPPYNADEDGDNSPADVVELRRLIHDAAGVFWATPEYNYAVPGIVKNVIDWISRPIFPQNCLVGKPMNAAVATISTTNGARALSELKRMWNTSGGFSVPLPDCVITMAGTKFSEADGVDELDATSAKMVALAVACLVRVCETNAPETLAANWQAYVKALSS